MTRTMEIPLEKIKIVSNVRNENDEEIANLAQSIKEHGQIQPIVVVPMINGKYRVVCGHRRFLAMKRNHEESALCTVRTDLDDVNIPIVQLIENTNRKDMSCFEIVETLEKIKLRYPGITTKKLSELIGRSPEWIRMQYGAVKTINTKFGGDVKEYKTKVKALHEKNRNKKISLTASAIIQNSWAMQDRKEHTLSRGKVKLVSYGTKIELTFKENSKKTLLKDYIDLLLDEYGDED